jgi:hypothetical protein
MDFFMLFYAWLFSSFSLDDFLLWVIVEYPTIFNAACFRDSYDKTVDGCLMTSLLILLLVVDFIGEVN